MGANDRFVIVDAPPVAPGTCGICLSNSRGPFVDTRVDDPWKGVLYICKGCAEEIYRAFGEIEEASFEEKVAERLEESKNEGFLEGLQAARDTLNDVAGLYRDSGTFNTSASLVTAGVAMLTGVSEDSPREGSSRDGSNRSGKQSGRSVKQQGRDDLSSDTGDGQVRFQLPDD